MTLFARNLKQHQVSKSTRDHHSNFGNWSAYFGKSKKEHKNGNPNKKSEGSKRQAKEFVHWSCQLGSTIQRCNPQPRAWWPHRLRHRKLSILPKWKNRSNESHNATKLKSNSIKPEENRRFEEASEVLGQARQKVRSWSQWKYRLDKTQIHHSTEKSIRKRCRENLLAHYKFRGVRRQ